MEDKNIAALLEEIRDLLIPIAAHHRPEYEKQLHIEREARATRLAQMVRGTQARKACLMMDATNDQARIRQDVGIGSGNLSLLISRLEEEGMLVPESDRRNPSLIFKPDELQAIFGGPE